MTVNEIDRFRTRLENTEQVDERAEYYKSMAIQYLKLFADATEDKGKRRLKEGMQV